MKGSLRVVTFSHEFNAAVSNLEGDCKRIEVPFTVLGIGAKWDSNTLKLRLLRDFAEALVKEEILLVIDAFDVRITGNSESILNKIRHLKCDILFGAEANFYFRSPELENKYWNIYPRKGTYHYLNSGTFIGKKSSVLKMIEEISSAYSFNVDDDDQIRLFQSDQSLYSRYYVDTVLNPEINKCIVALDTEQELFGCTGGAMAVFNWSVINMEHQRIFFREERKLIKTFYLRPYQIISRDLKLSGKNIINARTGTAPDIIHLPGTQMNFDIAWRFLIKERMSLKWHMIRWMSLPISLVAYLFSFVKLVVTRKPKGV